MRIPWATQAMRFRTFSTPMGDGKAFRNAWLAATSRSHCFGPRSEPRSRWIPAFRNREHQRCFLERGCDQAARRAQKHRSVSVIRRIPRERLLATFLLCAGNWQSSAKEVRVDAARNSGWSTTLSEDALCGMSSL